jgi:3-deoxy-D-manno-octulosonic-acid transferase
VFVVVETDFWPNLLAGLAGRGVPAVLVNGRISPRSLKGYRRVAGFWSRVLHLFAFIGCQTDADRDRFLSLGAPPDRTVTVGNLKYDRRPPDGGPPVRAALLEETGLPDGRYLVGGSTHPGEEDVLLGVFRRLGTDRPDLRLILAPRNPERSEAVWRSIQKTGLAAARRSAGPVSGHPAVFLLDTLGELDRFFELADVVFMGKSLDLPGEGGGHNLLEPAAGSRRPERTSWKPPWLGGWTGRKRRVGPAVRRGWPPGPTRAL